MTLFALVLLITLAMLGLWALKPAVALTANREPPLRVQEVDTWEVRRDVVALAVLYRDALVGRNPAGYIKPFVPGDKFEGISTEAVTGGATDGAEDCGVRIAGYPWLPLTGVTVADIGKPAFALDSNIVGLTGHPDAYVGRVFAVAATNLAVIKLKEAGEVAPNGQGSILLEVTGHEQFSATGADGATHGNVYIGSPGGALEGKSILGTGITPIDGENGGVKFTFDAVAEVALASLRTINDCLPVDKGLTLSCDFVAADSGDNAALDIDIGFGTALTTNSEADLDHADMAQLFGIHIDGNSDNILAQSDNATTDVAPVDTTVDNDSATDVMKHLDLIVRPDGSGEVWLDGVRKLATTAFALLSTANVGAHVNMEKTSDNTTAELQIRNLRIGAGA